MEVTRKMSGIGEDIHHRLLTARLPALPQVLLRLLELCRREDSGLDDIARLVAQEAALSARLLALSASASRHGRGAPQALLPCLMQLGLDTARMAIMAETVHQVFDGMAAGRGFDLSRFWRHSLGVASLSRRIARASGYPHVEEAYLGGLLHDIGQLALATVAPNDYHAAFSAREDGTWLTNWEDLTLGLTHVEVGAWLALRWGFDPYLADAMLYHHEPAGQVAAAHPLVRIVWLAHALEGEATLPETLPLDMDRKALAEMRAEAREDVVRSAAFLGVDLDGAGGAAEEARRRLTEDVRGMALAGAMPACRPRPEGDLEQRAGAMAMAARSLFGVRDGVLFRERDGVLRGLAPWPHLRRLEELTVPLGEAGGGVGRVAASARPVACHGEAMTVLDSQIARQLGGEALLCLPLGVAPPCPVAVFATEAEHAAMLLAQPVLLQAYARETAFALDLGESNADKAEKLPERVRRAVHEANNPLGIIKNYLHVLSERLDDPALAEDMALVKGEIDRVGRILRRLAVPETADGQGADLNRAAAELLKFCLDSGFVPAGIRLELAEQAGLPPVRASRDEIKQILLNLVKNAVESLGDTGQIAVTTSGPVSRDERAFAVLRVGDSGPGLPEAVRAALFTPVKSGKGDGHAGLGLAIVGELVDRLGGLIEVGSGDSGTVFELFLPLADAPES